MSINQRVAEWIKTKKSKGVTQLKIAEEWGVKPQHVSALAKQKGSVGISVINQILDYDKQLNARWLVLNEGKMYEVPDNNVSNYLYEGNNNYQNVPDISVKALISQIVIKDEQIKEKDDQIKFLQHIIEEKL